MIVIAGNEPFTQGPVAYADAIGRAVDLDITVTTIHCGDRDSGINGSWHSGASIGNGYYHTINHNQAVIDPDTPYDQLISELNNELNTTYISYGIDGKKSLANQRLQDGNALGLSNAAFNSRASVKLSGNYNNRGWDLVDASKEKDFNIGDINRQHLDKRLQDLSDEDLNLEIIAMHNNRQRIQKELMQVVKLRQEWITNYRQTKQKNTASETLGAAIRESLVQLAARKGFRPVAAE
jgi:hypothetical protein